MTSARDTPNTAATTTAADTPAPLPLRWHEQTEHEVAVAYAQGWDDALTAAAERADALDQSWRPVQRRDPQQVIAERAASLSVAEGVDAWLDDYARRTRRHDDETIALGERTPPQRCNRCQPPPSQVCVCLTITELRTAGPTTRRAA